MIEPGAVHWYVNRPKDVDAAALPAWLAQGLWVSPSPQDHRAKLAAVQPGQPIACKSIATRTTGLPFFTGDNPASVMTIHATGRVRSVDPGTGTLEVDWSAGAGDREWYFWTGVPALWRVTAGRSPMGDQLLAFTFDGVPQDLSGFLADPYWHSRFAPNPGFTWIPFYEQTATRLLRFREDRTALVAGLGEISATHLNLEYMRGDQFADGTVGPVTDVDPFTMMGTFSRGLTMPNRQSVAEAVGGMLGVPAPVPADIDGVPLLNNQKSWFVGYAKDRSPDDIPRLWRAFAAGLGLAQDPTPERRREFVSAYDDALLVRGVKWNLSVGLYWARPNEYVPLDAQSRAFLTSRYGLTIPADGEGYLRLRDELRARLRGRDTSLTSFPLLSHAAWRTGQTEQVAHSLAGLAHWAARMDESTDLDEIEHDYKRNTAALAARARDLARAGDPTWPAAFKRALSSTNTVNYLFIDTVNKAIVAAPEAMLGVLDLVWEDPRPESLDAFQDALRESLGRVTPGNATGLGALLLMSRDPEANAPYSPTRTEKWYQLTGWPAPPWTTSATNRYRTMLDFLDAFRATLSPHLAANGSRLEAQGLAWAATENSIPTEWVEAERKALESWRAGPAEPPRAWLVRAKTAALSDWLGAGYVSLAASHLGEVPPGADKSAVRKAVESGYEHQDYARRQTLVVEYHAFLSRMRPGDVVAVQAEERLNVGRITGGAEYVGGEGDRLRRPVEWAASVARAELPAPLPALLDTQGTVVELTEGLEALLDAMDEGPITPPPEPTGPTPQDATPTPQRLGPLPAVTASVAAALHTEVAPLQEIVDLLQSRRQVVLYGPPGTGKTYIAMALARHIVGEEHSSHHQLVQFHPSYAYEDFFEGYRPTETEAGQATFRIEPGPLRRIASEARDNPGLPFVLIIDEMNRANLAKVFGELYFLLEYRDRTIRLQYRPEEAFQLPANLFIIGTMNTADRSIALLDAAMRRRFAFIELHPDEPPVRDVLANFLAANHRDGDPRAGLLAALNAAIEDTDRDFKIGPSYLMRAEAQTDAGLERIWRHDILPLLEEHYYGRMTRAEITERFGLKVLRRGLAGAAPDEAPGSIEGSGDAQGPATQPGEPAAPDAPAEGP